MNSPSMIDARAPRFAAWLTTAVLAVVLLTASAALLAAQAVVFALGTRGRSPYSWVFRTFVRPRLGEPTELEDPRPPQFAQVVGLAFALTGSVALAFGATALGLTATAAALAAAFLNAAFGVCLGCELYLTVKKLTTSTKGAPA